MPRKKCDLANASGIFCSRLLFEIIGFTFKSQMHQRGVLSICKVFENNVQYNVVNCLGNVVSLLFDNTEGLKPCHKSFKTILKISFTALRLENEQRNFPLPRRRLHLSGISNTP